MFVCERINALRVHYGLPGLPPKEFRKYVSLEPSHDLLDELDKLAKIDTRWEDGHYCESNLSTWTCEGNHKRRRYVGARVALHEDRLGWRGKQPRQDAAYWSKINEYEKHSRHMWAGVLADA